MNEFLCVFLFLFLFCMGKSYTMRNGIVSMIGKLIEHGFMPGDNSHQSMERKQRQKNDLFDILEKRVCDNSSYTRSKVLQIWTHLVQQRVVPAVRLVMSLMPVAKERLYDKSSIVRRYAIHLLTNILSMNPWGAISLSRNQCETEVSRLRKEVSVLTNHFFCCLFFLFFLFYFFFFCFVDSKIHAIHAKHT